MSLWCNLANADARAQMGSAYLIADTLLYLDLGRRNRSCVPCKTRRATTKDLSLLPSPKARGSMERRENEIHQNVMNTCMREITYRRYIILA